MATLLTSSVKPRLVTITSQIALMALLCVLAFQQAQAASISGKQEKWHPINLDFTGPQASEQDTSPNPFLDLRLTVTLTSPGGRQLELPGFFAGDGNGNGNGNVWRAKFAADETGTWQYQASLRSGSNIAVNTSANAGSAVTLDGSSGSFTINQQSSDSPGFLKLGRLNYIGEHYMKFADGPYWIKSGTDSPENFLGYAGIDGTEDAGGIEKNFLHQYTAHRDHWRSGDPLFSNSKTGEDSLGIIGSLNYLADEGVNSIYFLPMNLGGDGQETFPFVGYQKTAFNKSHYDISKLHQWDIVLSHAQQRGIALNIVLSETERANETWLDNGDLGVERKLFFRELIARFGYLLAAKWNLGEESDFAVSELKKHADYIRSLDWSNKPIAVHTQIDNFRDYPDLVGHPSFSASSIQYNQISAGEFVETWRKNSKDAGRPWIIDMDENTGGVTNNNAAIRRKQILYDVYFSGGNIEWYFGYHTLPIGGDVTAGDFTLRDKIWQYTRYAREFMEQELPFWRMEPADDLVTGESSSNGGAEVFAAKNETYAIYLPSAANTATIDLSGADNTFTLRWFNPSTGNFSGGSTQIEGGKKVSLGNPPSGRNDDWVALLQAPGANNNSVPDDVVVPDNVAPDNVAPDNVAPDNVAPDNAAPDNAAPDNAAPDNVAPDNVAPDNTAPDNVAPDDVVADAPIIGDPNSPPKFDDASKITATAGELLRFTVITSDSDGYAPVISAPIMPPGMVFVGVDNGVATLEWPVPSDATGTYSFEMIAIDVNDANLSASRLIEIEVAAAPLQTPPTVENAPIEDEVTNEPPINDDVPTTTSADQPPAIYGAVNLQLMVGERLNQIIYPVDPEGIVAALRAESLPTTATFDDNGNGTRMLSWTPAPGDLGIHEITFIATDAGSTPFVTQTAMRIEVVDQTVETAPLFQANDDALTAQNFPPLLTDIPNQSIALGETFVYRVKPVDPEGIAPILHIIELPEGASFSDNGDGSRTFVWTPTTAGSYDFRLVATDSADATLSAEATMNLVVTTN